MTPCSTNYREYEFDTILYATYDNDVDITQTYENQIEVGEKSRVWYYESHPTNDDVSLIDVIRTQRNLNIPLDEIALGLDLLVYAFDDYILNAIQLAIVLSLTYPELIDWNSNTTSSKVPPHSGMSMLLLVIYMLLDP